MTDLEMCQAGVYRQISNRRARKLRKRGSFVRWSVELNSYVWEPLWLAPNPDTEDGLPWVDNTKAIRRALG